MCVCVGVCVFFLSSGRKGCQDIGRARSEPAPPPKWVIKPVGQRGLAVNVFGVLVERSEAATAACAVDSLNWLGHLVGLCFTVTAGFFRIHIPGARFFFPSFSHNHFGYLSR